MEQARDLLPGEYAVLGLLAVEPQHGYELHRRWQDSPLADVLPAEQGVIYGYLRTLDRRGLLDWEERRVGNRPPRRVYTPGEPGWELLRAWLRTPVYRMREVRLDLLLKLYVIRLLDPRAEQPLLDRQIEVCERYLRSARLQLDSAVDFSAVVQASRVSAAEATLQWLRSWRRPSGRRRAS